MNARMMVVCVAGLAGCARMVPGVADGKKGLVAYEIDSARGPWQVGEDLWLEVAGFDVASGAPLGLPDSLVHEVFVLPEDPSVEPSTVYWDWLDDHVRRSEWAMAGSGTHTVLVMTEEVDDVNDPYPNRILVDYVEFEVEVR